MSLHDQDDPAHRAAQEERLRADMWAPPKGIFCAGPTATIIASASGMC